MRGHLQFVRRVRWTHACAHRCIHVMTQGWTHRRVARSTGSSGLFGRVCTAPPPLVCFCATEGARLYNPSRSYLRLPPAPGHALNSLHSERHPWVDLLEPRAIPDAHQLPPGARSNHAFQLQSCPGVGVASGASHLCTTASTGARKRMAAFARCRATPGRGVQARGALAPSARPKRSSAARRR